MGSQWSAWKPPAWHHHTGNRGQTDVFCAFPWLRQELMATCNFWLPAPCNLEGKLTDISQQLFSLQEWQIFKSTECICLPVTNAVQTSFLTRYSCVFPILLKIIWEHFCYNQRAEVKVQAKGYKEPKDGVGLWETSFMFRLKIVTRF